MPKYLIEIGYTPDEYLDTIKRIQSESPELLDRTLWGEMLDELRAWVTVEAGSEREARNMLPANLQDWARIAEVHKVTPQDIEKIERRVA